MLKLPQRVIFIALFLLLFSWSLEAQESLKPEQKTDVASKRQHKAKVRTKAPTKKRSDAQTKAMTQENDIQVKPSVKRGAEERVEAGEENAPPREILESEAEGQAPVSPPPETSALPEEEITPPTIRQEPALESPRNAIMLGLSGRGLLYALTYDYLVHPHIAVGAGLSYWPNLNIILFEVKDIFAVQAHANAYFSTGAHRAFFTAGATYMQGRAREMIFSKIFNAEESVELASFSTTYGTFGLGYEYRQKGGHFIFRVAPYFYVTEGGAFLGPGELSFGYAF